MPKPLKGIIIPTDRLKNVKILEEIGNGGQGTVYKVEYDGEIKALKWYHDSTFVVYKQDTEGNYIKNEEGKKIIDQQASKEAKKNFYDNLKNNIEHGSPSPEFLWPQDITKEVEGTFGYIMDLRPVQYIELSKLLIGKKYKFNSYLTKVDAMINLVNAFRVFHNKGYSYQDLNDGNFFFNPDTGEILICDNDNASYAGRNTGILGKCRFMAPEVVLGQKMPDTMTDRFSMAVILFFILFRSHPLEGAAATPPCLTPTIERIIYGKKPIFVFDSEDKSNRPLKQIAQHSAIIWNRTPVYVQDAFKKAFDKKAMQYDNNLNKYGSGRLSEKEWLDVLIHFRNAIIRCSNPACKKEEFFTGNPVCSKCGKPLPIVNAIRLSKYGIAIHKDLKLFKSQLGTCSDDTTTKIVAEVCVISGYYGLKNTSGETWNCTTSTGANRDLQSGESMPVKAGIKVKMSNGDFEII